MLKREKFSSGLVVHISAKIVSLFCLLLFLGCSKSDDNEVVTPDIALNKSELTLEKGKTERLIASFTPTETLNKGHVWSSSAPGIAMVDESGMVTAVESGEAVVTATALVGKKKATCKVTVVAKVVNVTGVSIKPTEATMVAGDELTLEATVVPENATNKSVIWSSGDGKIATVDAATGKVTAVSEGKVSIKATTKDGDKAASCQITVVNKGVEISKPEVSDVTSISAVVSGTVKALGVKLGEVGICYSTAQSPTVNDKKIALSGESLSYAMTKLEASTTYFVRIYAILDGAAKYGDQTTFTTEAAAEISAPQISSITSNAAYISATIKTFGMQTEEVGICYSTSAMPTIDNTKVIISGSTIGYTLNELKPETTYYVRIFAKINGKYYYGEQDDFKTMGILKTHFETTDIYADKILLKSAAPSGVSKIDICYGTSPNPSITDNVTTATEVGGKLYLTLSGLKGATTYYIRAYSLKNSSVEYYGDEVSVQTLGNEFKITNKYTRYSTTEETYPVHMTLYTLFFDMTYEIIPKGTYKVDMTGGGYLAKTADYVSSMYIENGSGKFYFKKDGGKLEYSGANTYIYFSSETDIRFTNIDNNICYHYIMRASDWYVL
ncbi:Ig-like domain-containing protein [Bacteroides helcogenes]|uniref:Ig domain protein group 2 domain protein n=1 Tax=Bacteroides helcogenes (strain ATCC 35417 / DSM 20613 / JCM 6297 / CCUG 15421 / P 36-108) TaxID=693979 RepID=E6SMU9_BACT6|nr:Ig-like domain-containing protein [Bacteroides helcogenes]ADV42665.1 Ig domain protein group 2 domain protein [Bacteroides helcogenes P 36-108]